MKAWRVNGFGEPESTFVIEDVPEPTVADLADMTLDLGGWVPRAAGPKPHTAEVGGRVDLEDADARSAPDFVIMQMSAAALALPDVTMSRGTYPVTVARPYTSGQEGVGVVTDATPAMRHLIGRRVCAVTIQPFGSLAPVAVGVGMTVEVPAQLDDEAAAGFLIPSHTAYHAVHRRGRVESGESVAVLGAAGGIGSAAVQLCVAAGADVIAIVGGIEKAQFCRDLGAKEAVDHSQGDFVEAVRAVTGGRGVDAIIDPVQGEMGGRARAMLVPDGRHVLCGHAGGLKPIDPNFYVLNHTLVGATLGGYPPSEMKRIHEETHGAIERLLDAGTFRPTTTRVIDFTEVPQALADLGGRRTMGRVVVRI